MTDEKETPETEEAEAREEPVEVKAEAPEESSEEERYTRNQLQRLTTKKLREIALGLGEIVGVHGMKKDELVDAIFELRGIEEIEGAPEPTIDKSALKSEIRELKALRDSAIEAGDALELKRVRKRIKKLKRVLRKVS